jgi:hypothetical protein
VVGLTVFGGNLAQKCRTVIFVPPLKVRRSQQCSGLRSAISDEAGWCTFIKDHDWSIGRRKTVVLWTLSNTVRKYLPLAFFHYGMRLGGRLVAFPL